MDAEAFSELAQRLEEAEKHKSRGTIGYWRLRRFVEIIDAIETNLVRFRDTQHCRLGLEGTIAPTTTVTKHYVTNPSMTYRGPYTAVEYASGNYQVNRIESETSWLATRPHTEGAELRFVARESTAFSLSALGHVFKDFSEFSDARVSLNVSPRGEDCVLSLAIPIAVKPTWR